MGSTFTLIFYFNCVAFCYHIALKLPGIDLRLFSLVITSMRVGETLELKQQQKAEVKKSLARRIYHLAKRNL